MGELQGASAEQGLWVVPSTTAWWSIPGCFAVDLSSLRALTEQAQAVPLGGCRVSLAEPSTIWPAPLHPTGVGTSQPAVLEVCLISSH